MSGESDYSSVGNISGI